MAIKFKKRPAYAAPPWLVSMGDMNNLLMCFFIVLMGDIAPIEQNEFFLMLTSFKGSLGIMEGGKSISKGRLVDLGHNVMSLPSKEQGRSTARALRKAMEVFKPEIQAKTVRMREDERGLVITLSGDAYFDPGSAKIKEPTRQVLEKIAGIVKSVRNYVRIEGHTDNRPLAPPGAREGYETNWELSSARGVNVLRYLAEDAQVDPKQMSAVAFGQYRPIDDNNTPEGRAYNRRIEIVILRDRMIEEGKEKEIKRPLPDEEWR